MKTRKTVRILKKVNAETGTWGFVTAARSGNKYLWDKRPGQYFLEWWEGPKRRREAAGASPSEALEAQRRKGHELVGQMVAGKQVETPAMIEGTPLDSCVESFLVHVRVHSPDKQRTHARYRAVLDHFQRIVGKGRFVETIGRREVETYKAARAPG